MSHRIKLAVVAVTLAATGIAAYAATTLADDATTLPQTRVSLAQAIAAAEQHGHGHATRAELEHSAAGLAFDVEVVQGTKVMDVKVDPEKGSVMSSSADQADRDDGHDPQD